MRINVFIHLLDERLRSSRAEKPSFDRELQKALSRLGTDEGLPEPEYRFHFSDSDNSSEKRARAIEVRDRNQDFHQPLRVDSEAVDRPMAVSNLDEFSIAKIEKTLMLTELEAHRIADAHGHLDRERVRKVLSS